MEYLKLIQRLGSLRYAVDKKYRHPEANVLEHSLQTFNTATRESNDKELQVAALFHDIGKGVESLGHDKLSVEILQSFGIHNEKILWLIGQHIRVKSLLDSSMKKTKKAEELINNKWFLDLIRLHRYDLLGRNPNKTSWFRPEEINQLLLDIKIIK